MGLLMFLKVSYAHQGCIYLKQDYEVLSQFLFEYILDCILFLWFKM